jgi:hypothetical protein
MQRLEVKHLIGGAVAAACVALAMAGGGFEPTAFAAAGLIVWIAALLALAVGVLPRSEPPAAATIAGLALAGLAAFMGLSMAWASDDGHAFEDVVRTLAYLGGFALVVLASKRAEARPWLAGLTVGLTVVGAIALLARFEPSIFGNPDADLAASLPAAIGRLTYPIGYWNGLAAVMAAAVVLLSWSSSTAASRWLRCASVAALPPVLLALWMTDSRGGIAAALLAFGVLVLTGPSRARLIVNLGFGALAGTLLIALAETRGELLDNPVTDLAATQGDQMLAITAAVIAATFSLRYALDRPIQPLAIPRQAGRIALAGIAVGAVIAVVAIDPVKQWDEFKAAPTAADLADGDVGLLRGGGSGRYQFWETAVDAFASSPVGGVGASGYTPYWFEHREIPIPATRAHSVVFETLAELGIVGFALFATFFGCAAVSGVRRARAPDAVAETGPALALLVVGLAAAAVDWTWDLPAVFGITVVAAALLTGPATLAGPDPGPPSRRYRGQVRSRRRFAAGVVLLLVAWLAICGSGLLLLSAHSLESSRDAAGRGDIDAAVSAANDAIDLQPWAAEPRTQLALVYEQAGDIEAARTAISEAIERSPDDYRIRLLASRMAAEADDDVAARAELLAAHRLNPRDPEIIRQIEAIS